MPGTGRSNRSIARLAGVISSTADGAHLTHKSRRHSRAPSTVTSFTWNPVSVYLRAFCAPPLMVFTLFDCVAAMFCDFGN